MNLKFLHQFALWGLANTQAVHATSHTNPKSPIVSTSYGSVLGTNSSYREGVEVFKGIPYAAPPVDSLRWTPPQKPHSWEGIRNATTFQPQCAQTLADGPGLWTTGSSVMSEDCLYLNIWRPAGTNPRTDRLPVYLWMYGGRFEDGSGDVVTYDGSGLAVQDIIVVTFNYRVGAFGFLAHPELSAESPHGSSGNYGVMDLIEALKWVHEEIGHFGGDPDQITVGGQSSGSSCALDMLYSPLSSQLIAGVIAESGARAPRDPLTGSLATSYRTMTEAEADGKNLMQQFNVTSIAELRQVPMETLVTTVGDANSTLFVGTRFENVSGTSEPPLWRPVLDGYVLPMTYGKSLHHNAHADVPVLVGNNADESGASTSPGLTMETYYSNFTMLFGDLASEFFELYPASNVTQANLASNAVYRDISRVSTWQWANEFHAGGARNSVFTYYWTYAPPAQDTGAFHGAEMCYVFNNVPYCYPSEPFTEIDYEIQSMGSSYWVNFIKTGDPNGRNLTYWPASDSRHTTMLLGESVGTIALAESSDRVDFVKKFFAQNREW